MKLFIDVDNTILEQYGFYDVKTESRIHRTFSKYPSENQSPIEYMYKVSVCPEPETVKNLFLSDNVYILTKFNSIEYEIEKKKRLSEIFDMTVSEIENLKDSNGCNKYLAVEQNDSKVDVVLNRLNLDNINDCILVDDYSGNILEWEKAGGIGIKFYNEYNSPIHPTNGLAIKNFKIFEYYLNSHNLNNILISGINRYKLKELTNELKNIFNCNYINYLELIYSDLISKLQVKEISDNSKYSHYNFIVEYYNFMSNVDKDYWVNKLDSELNNNLNIISSGFYTNVDDYKKIDLLSICITSSKVKEYKASDVYLTIKEERLINNEIEESTRLVNIINNIIKKGVN